MLLRDARQAGRGLKRNPGFAMVAILTLALGVGANSAILSLVYSVLFAPLPYPDADRLVRVFLSSKDFPRFPLSPPDFVDYRRETRAFTGLAVYTRDDVQLSDAVRPERLAALRVSHDLFQVLGYRPALGRGFEQRETLGRNRVAILSDGLWRRRFGGDRAILGRTLRLNGEPWTVVGVMPAGFAHVGGDYRTLPHGETVDLWLPFDFQETAKERYAHYVNGVGRLRRGVTPAEAEADLNRVAQDLARRFPNTNAGWRVWVMPLQKEIVGGTERPLLLLLAAVAMVLLIACANLANLLLARGSARRGEIAVRAALGAGRAALVRFALAETMWIALGGAAAGLALAVFGLPTLLAVMPEDFPRLHALQPRAAVLAAGAAISVLAALLFGLLPALQSARADVADALRDSGRRATSGRRLLRLRGSLVVSEIALATALLFGAGLLLRSYFELARIDHGFDPRGVLTFQISLPRAAYPKPEDPARFFSALLDRLRQIEGVRAAGAVTALPWTGWNENTGFDIVGAPEVRGRGPHARFNAMTPGLRAALGVPMRAGRDFSEHDTKDSPPVVLINEALARTYFPGQSAVGRKLRIWDDRKDILIAGVIGDIKDAPADEKAEPAFFWPLPQQPFFRSLSVVVRTAGRDPLTLVPAVRNQLAQLDRELPMAQVRALESVAAAAVALRRFILTMVLLFAGLAVALAAVGVYGVLAYAVVERKRELAIRMAFGASRRKLLGGVLRQGLVLGGIGLGAGLAVALPAARLVRSLLYGVAEYDLWTVAAVCAGTALVASLASLIPAWRATRVEPVAVLRAE